MTYDFTFIMERHGKDALAVDGLGSMPGFAPDPPKPGFDAIPMWIADMNFPTVPTIPQAIIERAQHPAFGYFQMSDDYFNAIADWQRDRNGIADVPREAIGDETALIGGLMSAVAAFAAAGDPHPSGGVLQPAQAMRPRVGAWGDRAGDGRVPPQ